MKPQFEQVTVAPGESWTLLWRELPELPFLWHYHPEYELTLTLHARGQRYVGDSIEDFDSGDLVLVGPNQPHTWAASERPGGDGARPMLAVVVWFTEEWLQRLIEGWPELALLKRLASDAGRGLHFSRRVAAEVQPLMLALRDLAPVKRLPLLLQILPTLAGDSAARMLATHAYSPAGDKSRERTARMLQRLHAASLAEPPSAQDLADEVALSLGAFHRFFKRHIGMTMLDYLAQLRIGAACQLLIDTERPISVVAMEAGYGTAAHFNRQFLQRKQMTPREFRARYRRRVKRATGPKTGPGGKPV